MGRTFAVIGFVAALMPMTRPLDAVAGACPPRVHLDPAPNEQCGREHYESAAAARRCAYADALARLTPQERKQCEMDARVEHAERAAAAASADAAAARAAAETSARAAESGSRY